VEGAREPICSAKGKVTSGSSRWTNFTSINDHYLSIRSVWVIEHNNYD